MGTPASTFGGKSEMPDSIDHVLLTRFNVPTPGYESLVRSTDGWLEKRVALFEKYCLPSVRNQAERRFKWIVYFDPASPPWLKDRLERLNHDRILLPHFRSAVSREDLLHDVRVAVGTPSQYLLTTNLDNDDGLASDFTARVRQLAASRGDDGEAEGTPTAFYLANGLIRGGAALYSHRDQDNAFCSVLASWDAPTTCWADWHNLLHHSMPVIRAAGQPAWLQLVHDSNVSNRIHGRRVSPLACSQLFPELLADMAEPSRASLARDIVVLAPARAVRDKLRTAAKALIGTLGGQNGADRLKVFAARYVALAARPGKQ